MRWAGIALLGVGALVVVGYVIYLIIFELILGGEAPLALRIGVPMGLVGLLLLLGSVARERVRQRSKEVEENLGGVKP